MMEYYSYTISFSFYSIDHHFPNPKGINNSTELFYTIILIICGHRFIQFHSEL